MHSIFIRIYVRSYKSIVASCYNHFALACNLRPQNAALRHAVTLDLFLNAASGSVVKAFIL